MAREIDLTDEAADTEAIFNKHQRDVQRLAQAMEHDLEGLTDEQRRQYFADMSALSEQR